MKTQNNEIINKKKEMDEMLEKMLNNFYDLVIWTNPYSACGSTYHKLRDFEPTRKIRHVKLITMNSVFSGEMYFSDDNGALLIIPFCMVVCMTPCND